LRPARLSPNPLDRLPEWFKAAEVEQGEGEQVEGKLSKPPGLSGLHPRSTARHHRHPCSTSDVKHMLRHLHRTRTHLSNPSSIASAIHEDGHRTAVKATARARSLPLLADLATRLPYAAGTPRGGRRGSSRGHSASQAAPHAPLPSASLPPPIASQPSATTAPPSLPGVGRRGGVGRG
jgi:hypothetical protein